MSLVDENPLDSPGEPGESEASAAGSSESCLSESPATLAGDPISYLAAHPEAAHPPGSHLPEVLRISLSWVHSVVFGLFGFISLGVVHVTFSGYYMLTRQLFAHEHELVQF